MTHRDRGSAVPWPAVFDRLTQRKDLTEKLAAGALVAILSGEASDAQIAAFAVALRAKGETVGELSVLVRTMLEFATRVTVNVEGVLIDTCGTGGDRAGTVNVSTMAALIAAANGASVAKHGNRAASSQCGSADVLEQLGVVIDLGPRGVAQCIEDVGIGFCFAPIYHPAMRFAASARRDVGIATTFNFLGPLANPAGVTRQTVGVSDPQMAERVVGTLAELGSEHALVFYGHDGLDELTTTTMSTVFELRDGGITRYDVDPRSVGLPLVEPSDLLGGDAACNAGIVHEVLAGKPGPVRDVVLLNGAAALVVAGIADDLGDGVERAAEAIDDGRAAAVLEAWVRTSVAARDAGSG